MQFNMGIKKFILGDQWCYVVELDENSGQEKSVYIFFIL